MFQERGRKESFVFLVSSLISVWFSFLFLQKKSLCHEIKKAKKSKKTKKRAKKKECDGDMERSLN